jgi:hypothetical protein
MSTNSSNTGSMPLSGVVVLYVITIIYIIALYLSENSNPSNASMIEIFGLFIIIILEIFIGIFTTKNVLTLFLAVFMTWVIIFAPTLLIYIGPLKAYYADEFNSIFSNVIGYLFVSNSASDILSKLMMEKETDDDKLKETKRIVAQIFKSQNIFINQLTPSNFEYLWKELFSPLFPPDQQEEIRTKLSKITNQKFIIGKCIWYFYTCVLAINMSSFFMTL